MGKPFRRLLGGGACISSNWSISTREIKGETSWEIDAIEFLRLSDLRASSILFIAPLWLNIIFQLLYYVFFSWVSYPFFEAMWPHSKLFLRSVCCLRLQDETTEFLIMSFCICFDRVSRAREQSSNNRKLLFPLSPPIFLKPREKSPVGSSCCLSLVFCLQTRYEHASEGRESRKVESSHQPGMVPPETCVCALGNSSGNSNKVCFATFPPQLSAFNI